MEEREEREKREIVHKRINHREVPARKHPRHPAAPPHPARLRAGGRMRRDRALGGSATQWRREAEARSVGTWGAVHACLAPPEWGLQVGRDPGMGHLVLIEYALGQQLKTLKPRHARHPTRGQVCL